jgi:hypothetical protein
MPSIINASTAGAGGVITTADASGQLELQTAGVTRQTIDVNGNVGIGTSSPSNYSGYETLAISSSTGGVIDLMTGSTVVGELFNTATDVRLLNNTATGPLQFWTNGSERMRIDSSGIVMVGGTTARTSQAKIELTSPANTALSLYMFKTGQVEATLGFKSSTDSNFYIGSGSTSVGTNGVFLTNTGNSWSSVSDERQKNIIEPIENAVEKIITLRTVIGSYKNDDTNTRRPFLIAQDVQKVLPEAVSISDQETETLGMSYTDTIPLLVAAIKEQQAIITDLKARIEVLEGASA